MNKNKVGLILGFIVLAAVSFYVGNKFAEAKYSNFLERNTASQALQNKGQSSEQGDSVAKGKTSPLVDGIVISKNANSITVSTDKGKDTKVIYFTPQTSIERRVSTTLDDLSIGKRVILEKNDVSERQSKETKVSKDFEALRIEVLAE